MVYYKSSANAAANDGADVVFLIVPLYVCQIMNAMEIDETYCQDRI